ncbi:MAG: SdrD B-like domain-containing protein, partial [Bacteroidota bacterium]
MEHFIQFSLSKLISKLPISLFISFVLLLSCTSKQEQIDRVEFKKNGANYVAEATTYQLALTDDRIEVQTTQMQSGMKLNHAKKAPAFDQASQEIVYEEAFDKANLVVYDKGTGNVGYDIRLLPRGQIEDIQIELEDGENAYVAESGELIIPLENSEIRHSRPYAYQEIDGQTIEVDSRFTLAEGILSFEVGAYNQDYTLVIDPEISFVETSESMLMPTATLPIQLGMAAATCGSRSNGQVGQNLTATGFVFGIYDIREPDCPSNAAPNAPANWDAASAGVYHDPRWIAANLSEVYGLDIEYDNLTNPDFFLGACGVTNVVATNTNPISGGTGGEIFRIDGTSGNISVLASLPNADFTEANDVGTPFQHFAGLGNVSYNADNQVVYATNLSDGNIYTVDLSNGNTLQTYDPTPGTPDNTSLNFTQQERLVWGIEYNRCNGRLYYAKIAAGQSPDATIFSAGLNANGTIDGTDIQLEFTFDPQVPNPPFFPEQFAIVSDIEFSVDCQKMLLGTRTLSPQVPGDPVVRTGFFSGQAHRSRVFRFDFSGSSWTNFTNYIIGTFTSVEPGWNCGGGTAFGYSNYGDCGTDNAIDDAMVATGDALVFSGAASPNIYGLQISDIDGNQSGFPGNSYFVDLNGSIGSGTQVDKYTNFDVDVLTVIPCDLTISSITPDPVCPCGGTYEVDFALTWTDAPTTGDFQVSIDGGSTFTTVTRTNSAASGSETITLTGQSCDAAMKSVVVRFVGDDTCSDDSSYTAPAETPAPSINSIDDITVCDETSIVLPAIQGTNLTGNEAYFTQPNGGGDEFAAGAIFNISGNTTLYAFDSVEPPVTGCSDEEQFDIIVQAFEINATPALTPATCSVSTNNNDAQVTVSSIVNGIRAGISSPGNGSYDGDDFATIGSDNVSGGSITFMNLEPNQDYIIRVFSTATCFEEVTITTTAEVCKEILGAIGNYVWVDENSDGFQDAGEPGIPNVAVVLKDGSGTPLDTTYTDSDGKYLFPDLPAGDYLVDVLDGTDGTANTLPNSGLTQTT